MDNGAMFWLSWVFGVVASAISNMIVTGIKLSDYSSSISSASFCPGSGLDKEQQRLTKENLVTLIGLSQFCGACYIIQCFLGRLTCILFYHNKDQESETLVSVYGFFLEPVWMMAALPIYAIRFDTGNSGAKCMVPLIPTIDGYSQTALTFWVLLAIFVPMLIVARCFGINLAVCSEGITDENESHVIRNLIWILAGLILLSYVYVAYLYFALIYTPAFVVCLHFTLSIFNASFLKMDCMREACGAFRLSWDSAKVVAELAENIPKPDKPSDPKPAQNRNKVIKP